MSILWKKEQSVINKIKSYFEQIDRCRDCFLTTMSDLIRKGPKVDLGEQVEEVHRMEHASDMIQRAIVLELYQRALIPESRGDVLGLLEATDKVPNTFESVCWQLYLEKIRVPEVFHNRVFELVESNVEAYNLLREAVMGLFLNRDRQDLIQKIYEQESASDRLERCLIKDIFDAELEKAHQILLKEIVVNIGNISDFVQAVNDRLTLAIIKRRI